MSEYINKFNENVTPEQILEIIRTLKEGDTIVWDEPNGEVYKIKLEKKYPKGWIPSSLKEIKK